MVAKVMRWRPWPPLISRKYDVNITVQRLECGDWVPEGENAGFAAEIRWKGPKFSLGPFRRTVKRNCTREESLKSVDGLNDGVLVEWGEEFQSICNLSGYKDDAFHPWEVAFTVLHVMHRKSRNKIFVLGSAVLNLSDYTSKTPDHAMEVKVPLTSTGIMVENHPFLCISLGISEIRDPRERAFLVESPPMPSLSPSASIEISSGEKDEISALKAGLMKVKIFTNYVSTRRAKKACREEEGSDGRCSAKSEEIDYAYPFDTDSLEEGETDGGMDDSSVRHSFSYGTLANANYADVSYYSSSRILNEAEDWIYYSNHRRSDVGCTRMEELDYAISGKTLVRNSKRNILPWRKRKLSFRSPKIKGEPLLNQAYGEVGGDDIDFDRRQLSSDESLSFGWHKTDEDSNSNALSVSEFGDDYFSVGTWEQKDITSRDGVMKVQTQIFFASIDQRSERAAGESACTALVAVIADWLQNNPNIMPIKSQFDFLIRDGSLKWRNLCANKALMDRFPDKHFDLETVVEAKLLDLCVVPEKSFVGFFHPDGTGEESFEFLRGAMSFDNIWDEISQALSATDAKAAVFIVSWNDHFFVLKAEAHAYYIIDTLGERLHEGCAQAYILKFDKNTKIKKLPTNQASEEKSAGMEQPTVDLAVEIKNPSEETIKLCEDSLETEPEEGMKTEQDEELIFQGKEACKEYIKSFLAAIPIRELQTDIKKGLIGSTPLHHRLQIEFHYTQIQETSSAR